MRSLRGMTWGGFFYNLVSDEGKLQPTATTVSTTRRVNESTTEGSKDDSTISAAGGVVSQVNAPVAAPAVAAGTTSSATAIRKQQQDRHVEDLSKSLANLHGISVSIGESLAEHDEITNSLTSKTEETNDYALSVTLRAAQLTQRSTGSQAVLMGEFKLKTMHNNFLSVFDETVTLTPQFNWSTVFRIYCKENNLFAMQNVKTRRFLGLNFFGKVVVTSTGFGKNQEIFIDTKAKTGILFLASNWGNGGWLRPDKDGVLCTVTKSLLDREDRLLVTPLELTDADYMKLKNM